MSSDRSPEQAAAELLHARIGLKSDLSFRPRLARALGDLAATRGMGRAELVSALTADASLLDQLLDRVTIQETDFFRHPNQFDAVRTLLTTIEGPLLAWTAACANGQEAYSLAMLFGEARRKGTVLATDVSAAAIDRTSDGWYHEREMRGVSEPRRRQHFTRSESGWRINQHLRETVVAQRHNLIDPIPPRVARCQIVMCRNVLIYLSESHARLFLERLADAMSPAGYLIVGGAETLWQATDRFEPAQVEATYVYRPAPRLLGARTTVPSKAASARSSTRARTPARVERVQVPPTPTGLAQEHSSEQLIDLLDDQAAAGQLHLANGRVTEAIIAFRRWSYRCPDDPVAHLQLGVALDLADEHASARRANRAALAALDRCDPDRLAALLHGYDRAELRRLLIDRCSRPTTMPAVGSAGRPQGTP